MIYIYERLTEQLVRDRHQALAELYRNSQRPGMVATRAGSLLIRVGEWLRRDVEMPVMPVPATPDLRTSGCEG